jgi:hypothetical protein
MSVTPEAIRKLLDELEASRTSRKRAWENLQEIRWVLKDATGVDLPMAARKTIDLEGRVVKDGVRKIVKDRQLAQLPHFQNFFGAFWGGNRPQSRYFTRSISQKCQL